MCQHLTTGRAAAVTRSTMLWRTSEECEKYLSAASADPKVPHKKSTKVPKTTPKQVSSCSCHVSSGPRADLVPRNAGEKGACVRIACVGGGPAGLYASVLLKLRDPGHDVCVYERNEASTAPGWGVTFSVDLLHRLYRGDPASATQIQDSVLSWQEQTLQIRGARNVLRGGDVYNISRARLLEILVTRARDLGVRIEHGKEVGSPADLADTDLIVAADGLNSRMRQAGNFQTTETRGRNKHIWLGSDKLFTVFGYLFAPTDKGWLWAYAYAINDKHSTFIVECTPETYAGLGFDAMPTDEALPVLERIFGEYLDGHRLIGTLGDGSKAQWASFRTITNDHWHSGKVVLAGDSAHTANFTIGMG